MSKKLKNLKWQTVAVEGFPTSVTDNLQGFVGLEECTDYSLDRDSKRSKKKRLEKKRKRSESTQKEIPNKSVRLSNGFLVETCDTIIPSLTNEKQNQSISKTSKKSNQSLITSNVSSGLGDNKNLKTCNRENKIKRKLGESMSGLVSNLTPEDMLTWAEYKLPEPILKALTEMGFKQPTKIQQLTLPAAIHGRRDILGAAETGSGKTLAFGLPILTGIMKLKEKAEAGFDVYDLTYKKSSKKKLIQNNVPPKNPKHFQKKSGNQKPKDSSEDGYSSGEESNAEEKTNIENSEEKNRKEIKSDEIEDFIEEIVVPIKKKEISTDEGNASDSNSDDNYIHLSDMLDSDDLTDTSDDDKGDKNDENNMEDDDKSEVSIDESSAEAEDVNEEGIGCVKVIDNVEMPRQVVTKTGKPLYALIITPTRELAMQISRHLMAAAKYTGIRVATIVGGMAAVKQERVLRAGPEVVVATPGRLWELLTQGQPHLQQMDSVKFLAIDETDRMLERGHFEELHPLLERLNVDEARRSSRQNFVFSATLTMVHDLPAHLRGKKVTKSGKFLNRKVEKMTPEQKIKRLVDMIGMTEPKVVDITTQNLGTADTLTECRIPCSAQQKDAYLYYIMKRHPGRTIVFCNSIGCVKRLAQLLTILKCHPLPLHAQMEQRQRLRNLERFRDDPHGVLVATDVAARGLDIPDVDHVIHYHVPKTAENYVHRSGRTARAHKEGLTILMMEPAEAYLYSKICHTLNKVTEVPVFPVPGHFLSSLTGLMTLAREVDTLELKRRRTAQAIGWREKVAREMDMIVDDDDIPVTEADPSIDKALRVKKRQLDAMLTRPLFPTGFSFKYPTLNDPAALDWSDQDALQLMKNAIESGQLKKDKRKSKNAPLLKLEKTFKRKVK